VLGVASLAVVRSANAIDIVDDRKAKSTGFDIIYEARELDLPQDVRDGLAQV
jgi:photosystem II oxygen-evolving enhancer protein 3